MRALTLITALATTLSASPSLAKLQEGVLHVTLAYGAGERTYYLYVPSDAEGPRPAILLLHGSSRDGNSLVEKWWRLAAEERIVLIAPDAANPEAWSPGTDGPGFLRSVIADARGKQAIDPARIYVFGHSAGACWALQLALNESELYAAVAAHAGLLQPSTFSYLDRAKRKTPIQIQVGDRDTFFPPSMVRKTKDELMNAGFEVDYVEIKHHDHNYYGRSKSINQRAWEFLKQHVLPLRTRS